MILVYQFRYKRRTFVDIGTASVTTTTFLFFSSRPLLTPLSQAPSGAFIQSVEKSFKRALLISFIPPLSADLLLIRLRPCCLRPDHSICKCAPHVLTEDPEEFQNIVTGLSESAAVFTCGSSVIPDHTRPRLSAPGTCVAMPSLMNHPTPLQNLP